MITLQAYRAWADKLPRHSTVWVDDDKFEEVVRLIFLEGLGPTSIGGGYPIVSIFHKTVTIKRKSHYLRHYLS